MEMTGYFDHLLRFTYLPSSIASIFQSAIVPFEIASFDVLA